MENISKVYLALLLDLWGVSAFFFKGCNCKEMLKKKEKKSFYQQASSKLHAQQTPDWAFNSASHLQWQWWQMYHCYSA